MGSIRDGILLALVARLAGNADWTAQLRGNLNAPDPAAKVFAVVFEESEQKDLANQILYSAVLQVSVFLSVHHEDADVALDGGNGFRYLDRMVAAVEIAAHVPADWTNPGFTDVVVDGHEVLEPSEDNVAEAVVRMTFRYRHNVEDPGIYNPGFP